MDKEGHICPNADNPVKFNIKCEGAIAGEIKLIATSEGLKQSGITLITKN